LLKAIHFFMRKILILLLGFFSSYCLMATPLDSLKTELQIVLKNSKTPIFDSVASMANLNIVSYYFTNLNLDSAKIYLDNSYEFAQKSGSNYLINDASLYYITYYNYKSEFDSALKFGESVLENNPNDYAKSAALGSISTVYYFIGDYLNSLDYGLRGLQIEEVISPENTNISYSNIANLYSRLGDNEKAIEYFRKCQTIERINNDSVGIFVGYLNFCNAFANEKINDSADYYLEKAIKYRQFLKIDFYDQILIQHEALYHARNKNYPRAIALMDSSIASSKTTGDMYRFCSMSSHLSRVLIENNQLGRAKKVAEEAYEIATKKNIINSLKFLNKHLSKIEELNGNHKKALAYYKGYKLLEDSISGVEKEGNINRLKFIREKQEKDDALLKATIAEKETLIKRVEAEQQKKLGIILLFAIFILASSLVLALLLYRRNKKNLFKLEESQELLNIKSLELESYNVRLLEINKIKNKLLSLLAHDLRSPLAGIVSSINLIQEDEFSKKETDEILQEIYNAAQSNLQGLDNLVGWAKSQMEGLNISQQSFNLNIVLAEIQAELQNLFKTKSVTFKVTNHNNFSIKADKEMIKSAIKNLLTNAAKFSAKNQTIYLSVEDGGEEVKIQIQDEAGGIPLELQKQIFHEPITSSRGTSGERGSGIGLLLVKEFVNLNGGEISFKSEENKGTTFFLTLRKF